MTWLACDELFLKHKIDGHPERPERLQVIQEGLRAAGLLERLAPLPPRDATPEELALAHSRAYIERVFETCGRSRSGWLDPDTYYNAHTLAAARRAAGAALAACEAVAAGGRGGRTALCLVRPPGHHATRDESMGFCVFNNIAIAAKSLGRRALIVDWDAHHGNGTQAIVDGDPRIFFVSLHRWPLWPFSGRAEERGAGNIRNVPMPPSTPPDEYLRRFEAAVSEAVALHSPEFCLISAGFDTFWLDPIGGLNLREEHYGAMTEILLRLLPRNAPVVSLLEGGYHLGGLGACVESHLRALLAADADASPAAAESRSGIS